MRDKTHMVSIIALAITACSIATSPVVAGMRVKLIDRGWGTTEGGEFHFEAYGIPGYVDGQVFTTFCVEKFEQIVYKSAWYDVILSTEAMGGCANYGPKGPGGGDLLDPMTAYLFYHYTKGDLPGWENNHESADALQNAIWFIEDEILTVLPGGKAEFLYQQAFDAVHLSQSWHGLGGVRVMNLYALGQPGNPEYRRQDQLILIPAPNAILLGSIGAGFVGWLRIKRTF